jgi:hypothetical protein
MKSKWKKTIHGRKDTNKHKREREREREMNSSE